jgi:hypothetical protein
MNLFTNRKTLADAYVWKAQKEANLLDQIRIEQTMLRCLRTELAKLRKLEGKNLAVHYGWQSPEDVDRDMQPAKQFTEELEALFIEAMYQGTSEKLFQRREL